MLCGLISGDVLLCCVRVSLPCFVLSLVPELSALEVIVLQELGHLSSTTVTLLLSVLYSAFCVFSMFLSCCSALDRAVCWRKYGTARIGSPRLLDKHMLLLVWLTLLLCICTVLSVQLILWTCCLMVAVALRRPVFLSTVCSPLTISM